MGRQLPNVENHCSRLSHNLIEYVNVSLELFYLINHVSEFKNSSGSVYANL